MTCRTLVVGIGSPHGDDQIGWAIADELCNHQNSRFTVRKANTPVDLLNWVDDLDELLIVDGCRGQGEIGSVVKWKWPSPAIQSLRLSGSHDFSLVAVLELAVQLQKLPALVQLWTVEIDNCQPGTGVSKGLVLQIPGIVDAIRSELCDA